MYGAADDADFETTKAIQSKTSCKLGLTESASFTDERVALLLVSFCLSFTSRCNLHVSIQRVARLQSKPRRGTASIKRYFKMDHYHGYPLPVFNKEAIDFSPIKPWAMTFARSCC